jgi:hypothetical protein
MTFEAWLPTLPAVYAAGTFDERLSVAKIGPRGGLLSLKRLFEDMQALSVTIGFGANQTLWISGALRSPHDPYYYSPVSNVTVIVANIELPPASADDLGVVALLSPLGGSDFGGGKDVPMSADVLLYEGTAAGVSFFADGNLIGVRTNPPYDALWSSAPAGDHTLTAIVTDAIGRRHSSSAVQIKVFVPPGNDDFERSILKTGSQWMTQGRNLGASIQAGEPTDFGQLGSGGRSDRTVWWSWLAPTNGTYLLKVSGLGKGFRCEVFSGLSVTSLERRLLAVPQNPSTETRSAFKADAGQAYHIRVESLSDQGGQFELSLSPAESPPNDDFSQRLMIETSGSVTGTLRNASSEPAEPSERSWPGQPSVWYSWIAPFDGTFRTEGVDNAGIHSEVFAGSDLGSLRSLTYWFPAVFRAVGGETYQIRVDSFHGEDSTFAFRIRYVAPPQNDNFEDSLSLEGSPVLFSGSSAGASLQPGEWSEGLLPVPRPRSSAAASVQPGGPSPISPFSTNRQSIWWSWVAPETARYLIQSAGYGGVGGGGYIGGPSVSVHTGSSVDDLTWIAGDSYSGSIRAIFQGEAGTVYHIRYGATDDLLATNSFILRKTIPPPNDNFENRTRLSGGGQLARGTTAESSIEPGEPTVQTPYYPDVSNSVWWSWVAPNDGEFTLVLYNVQYSGTPYCSIFLGSHINALTLVASNAPTYGSIRRQIVFPAMAGTQYQIQISDSRGQPYWFQIRSTHPPVNDHFTNAIALFGEPVATEGTSVDSSLEPGEPTGPYSGASGSVWWKWTSPRSGTFQISSWLAEVTIFEGSALQSLAEVVFRHHSGIFDAAAGTEYQIQILAPAYSDPFDFKIQEIHSPTNDNFSDRTLISGSHLNIDGTTLLASREQGEPLPNGFSGGSVWYSWTAPVTGTVTLWNPYWTSIGAAIYREDSFAEMYLLAGTNLLFPELQFQVVENETYHIAVTDPYNNGSAFHLELIAPPPPPALRILSLQRTLDGAAELIFVSPSPNTNIVETSTDLREWAPISTNRVDCGYMVISDSDATLFPQRFYRIRRVP